MREAKRGDQGSSLEADPARGRMIAKLRRLRALDTWILGDAEPPCGSAGDGPGGSKWTGGDGPDGGDGERWGPEEASARGARRPRARYRLGAPLGRGGMGEVLRAYDRELGRTVALKRLPPGRGASRAVSARFRGEARTAARLEHPNIVPVYDTGTDAAGEPFFTMKWVRGRTLAEILRGLAAGDRRLEREYPLSRLVQILQSVCMAVSFAHERGVIHRDLKPANVLAGAFGEVHVVDWGLAEPSAPGSRRRHGRGRVEGTPAYMAPEQARGEAATPRTDVYGLGAILHEILHRRAPYSGRSAAEVIEKVRRGPPPAPDGVGPGAPAELERIARKAMSREPEARHASARAVHDELVDYLEGSRERERRRAAADRATAAGQRSLAERRLLLERARKARRRAERRRRDFEGHEPIARKRPLIALLEKHDDLAGRAEAALGRALEELNLALRFDAGHALARRELGGLHAELLLEAEERGSLRDAILHRRMLEAVNDGAFAGFLAGEGALSLETEPPGAAVRLYRYVEENLLLRPRGGRLLGRTPICEAPLPMGSYLLVVEKEGFVPVRYPVLIRRGGVRTARFPLLRSREIGAGFVYVPAGPFVMGGDPATLGAGERREVEVPGFLIARFPVTFRDYLREVNASGGKGAIPRDRFAPRAPGESGELFARSRARSVIRRDASGKNVVDPRWPVFGVSWEDAREHCRLRSLREGIRYRLPAEREWEKAARGADGRLFPWGSRFDPSLAKMAESRPAQAQPEPVGSFPTDTSPYGVRDLAGGIQEWVADWLNRRNRFRMIRGGAYSSREPAVHSAYRSGAHYKAVYNLIGFRLAKDLPV